MIIVDATVEITTQTVQHSEQAKDILTRAGFVIDNDNATRLVFKATLQQRLTDL